MAFESELRRFKSPRQITILSRVQRILSARDRRLQFNPNPLKSPKGSINWLSSGKSIGPSVAKQAEGLAGEGGRWYCDLEQDTRRRSACAAGFDHPTSGDPCIAPPPSAPPSRPGRLVTLESRFSLSRPFLPFQAHRARGALSCGSRAQGGPLVRARARANPLRRATVSRRVGLSR